MPHPTLWPTPRSIVWREGNCRRPTIAVINDPALPDQAYRLVVEPNGVTITTSSPAGEFHARQTLAQLGTTEGHACAVIDDSPDFPTRGVMLDISRDKVPTMATLFQLVDLLASWKINQLQLYTEHTFAYADHGEVWADASPMTGDEIRALDAHCKARFIDLVPNQNSFGHMERWLKFPRYTPLAEAIDGAETPWGFRWKGPFSLCPTDPATVDFLSGLYDELLPNFSSRFFNVGCDETFDVGQGRSKPEADRVGKTQVYIDFLAKVRGLVDKHGRRMMFWGDVILHNPERIRDIPAGVIALQWGYEATHPFEKEGAAFAAAGVPFYVCPGTSTWNSIAGRTDNAIANLKSAAESGLRHGAIGYLITDWGDNGHLQYTSASHIGFAAGAAYSWCLSSNRDADVVAAVDRFAFLRPGVGRVAWNLGNAYQSIDKANSNGSAIFRLLVQSPMDAHPEAELTAENLDNAEAAIDAAIAPLSGDGIDCEELRQAAALLRYAVEIGRHRLGLPMKNSESVENLVAEHRRLWLVRNRVGGLIDSVRRIEGSGGAWI
jgi:hexosaminidase